MAETTMEHSKLSRLNGKKRCVRLERMLGQISVRSCAIPDRLGVPTSLTLHPHGSKGLVVGALRSKKRSSGGLQ
jgi:hypothetical protein